MKKSLIGLVLAITMFLTLTGCGQNNSNTNKETNSNNTETNNEESTTSYTFDDLKADLMILDSSVEINDKSASLVGAEEGYGYTVDDCTLEVYKYNKNSDEYRKAEKNKQISMPSFDMTFDATVKNGYAYMVVDGTCDNVISYVEKLMK